MAHVNVEFRMIGLLNNELDTMSNYGVMAWVDVPYSQIRAGTAENL